MLKLRLGALPEADAAARVALRVLQEGDFAPGLGFAATILSDIAVEAGDSPRRRRCWTCSRRKAGRRVSATVLIPAARGRLRLAQGRAADALADFNTCQALFSADAWGMPIRETGYVHARSGAALALLRLGERHEADKLADAELADVRAFGAPRALGIALRAAGLARGGRDGLALLRESAATLDNSPALLERARSLAELGAALRRAGERTAAREPLARALELAVRLRRAATGRPGPRRAQGRRRPPAASLAYRDGRADPQRTARRPAGGRRPPAPTSHNRPKSRESRVERPFESPCRLHAPCTGSTEDQVIAGETLGSRRTARGRRQ